MSMTSVNLTQEDKDVSRIVRESLLAIFLTVAMCLLIPYRSYAKFDEGILGYTLYGLWCVNIIFAVYYSFCIFRHKNINAVIMVIFLIPAMALCLLGVFETNDLLGWSLPFAATWGLIIITVEEKKRQYFMLAAIATPVILFLLMKLIFFRDYGTSIPIYTGAFSALMTFCIVYSYRYTESVIKIAESKKTIKAMAIAEERLRFSAELHDIQGHHMQVILFKSELAEKLMSKNPAQALEQITDIMNISRQVLIDTRKVVNDYRHVDIQTELKNTETLFNNTSIECRVNMGTIAVDAFQEKMLGLALKEAVTNILKSSQATLVTIDLSQDEDQVTLKIVNDGVSTFQEPDKLSGGISDLQRRFINLNGRLETTINNNIFTFTAIFPNADK